MKKTFLLVTLLLPLSFLWGINVSGQYTIKGKDPNGEPYGGICTIKFDPESQTYTFYWDIEVQRGKAEDFEGTGTLKGNTLTIECGEEKPRTYKVSQNGDRLETTWGANNKGREILIRQKTK